MFNFSPIEIAARLISILFLLPIHECAHAFAASLMGDKTAKYQGRLSLNPLRHLEPIGAICLLLGGFGWAKPVAINPYNFKNRKGGMALSALAGPLSNFLVSFLMLGVARIIRISPFYEGTFLASIIDVLLLIAWISICLGVFNLIPLPPLDGSRIFLIFLPERYYFMIMQYERYISIGIMVLVVSGALDTPLGLVSDFVFNGMVNILF